MLFKVLCLSGPEIIREIEADNIKQARRIELHKEIEEGDIDLNFVCNLVEGNVTYGVIVLESAYEYNLDLNTCRSESTINDHDVFQILEGINVYVIDPERKLEYEGD